MADCLNWILFLVSVVVILNQPGWAERHPTLRLVEDESDDE